MLLFSERVKLEKDYYEWLDKHKNVKDCPLTVIAYLQIIKVLDDNEAKKYVNTKLL